MKIYAPIEFWNATQEEREALCNGCGSELDLSGKLVPDYIWGVYVRPLCCIHDWMYIRGVTLADKLFSDAMFLLNLCIAMINKGGWLLVLRLFSSSTYFIAVVKAGEKSFFEGKEKNDIMEITFSGTFKDLA